MTRGIIDTSLDESELRPPSLLHDKQQQVSDQERTCKESDTDGKVHEEKDVSSPHVSVPPLTEPGVRVVADLLRASSAEAQKSQFWMIGGVVVLSITLGASALCFSDEILNATGIQSGLLLGSVGSVSMCAVIIASFLTTKWYRRHMHILLLNLALCEFCLALSFLLEPIWNRFGVGVGSDLSCRWLSTTREYLIMCSSAWTTCTALDLYYLMTNPFTSPRLNRHKYQWIAHVTSIASAVIMGVSNSFGSPVAVGSFCWIGADTQARSDHISFKQPSGSTTGIWVFIVTPTTVSIVANLYVTLVSLNRFRRGVSPTLRNRRVLLREGFLTTVTLIVYSALLWSVYGAYWLVPSAAQARRLSRLFAFLLSYRGSVPFILWCLYNRPQLKKWKAKASAVVDGTATTDNVATTEDEDDEDEDAVRPQMNLALLDELVFYTTHGIAKAVQITRTLKPNPLEETILENGPAQYSFMVQPSLEDVAWTQCHFTAFRPLEFQRIRRFYGINDDTYLSSLQSCTTPKVSEGASGSFVYYSSDRSYVVKSLTRSESVFLHEILLEYTAYIQAQHGASFLTRFLGSYCLELYGRPTYFVVMENVFDVQQGISIHQRYDIKGSWVNRNAQKPRRGAEATCRHCNLSFRCGGNTTRLNSGERDQLRPNVCPNRAGAPHEPNVVLKDMDLTMKLRFGKDAGKTLLAQLIQDSDFLCARGVMDYSLLLGVIEVSYVVNRHNILTRDGSVFLPPDSVTKRLDPPWDTDEPHDNWDTTDRVKQSTQCLRAAEVVIGPGFYYIGVIDMLQTWNWRKRLERFIKTVVFRNDPDGISAMPPKPYRDRFHRKLREIIHLGHNSRVLPPSPKRWDTMDRRKEDVDRDAYRRPGTDDERDRLTRIRLCGATVPHEQYPTRDGQQLRGDSGEIPMTPSAQGRVLGASL